ncbi:bifunctional DNA-formamidopyrimidine glycosylase/DNA-(apurinic or apyrimidinic site) lyase [Candidatus Saccharibacteria bacterium]|nr:bifunctional DNA-formamidopyrimidine glycosylase/DNA-(apurinic or apyrimidinic site) lyase [Candidatus Saccharibacteria bacterium]
MPELPEVETIRRGLSERLLERRAGRILRVKVFEPKTFLGREEEITGREAKGLRRFGKALVVDLSGGRSLLIHLRMTGQLVWRGDDMFGGGHPNEDWLGELPNKHTRVEIEFERGKLFFNDQRKFGFIKVISTEEVEEDGFVRKLGKEPWEITGEELYEKLQRRKGTAIKAVLLNQEVIAGLGNIYADEALYFAGVSPMRKAGEVSRAEAEKLVEGARVVMERSLESGGSTIRNYVRSDGTRGNYLDLFAKVYGRGGEKCEKCGGEIKKVKVGGRGTHYCPRCQK